MTAVAGQIERVPARQAGRLPRRWLRTPPFVALFVLVAVALVGPFLVRDPLELGVGPNLAPPSGDFWFGTDQYGMDIFARVVHAARLDLAVGVGAAALAVVIGMPIGALAAMRGGLFNSTVLRVSESLQAFPTLLLALGIVAALGPSIPNLVIVIAVVNVPVYLRLTRSAVLPLTQSDFVLAARCAGQGNLRIMRRQILPNVAHVVLAQFSVNVAWAIQILAALSFIGLGVAVPTPEWGAMVRAGADYTIYGQWWVALFPGLAILVTVLILNQVSDSVRR
jgi:peptide/nickel transport system permease protein